MMRELKTLLGLVILILTVPHAQANYVASSGMEYKISCNSNGAQLTSVYPVTRIIGYGAATQFKKGIEKLYLGKSCDAFHPLLGGGEWCWANGGFRAEINEMIFGFPRQELYCQNSDLDEIFQDCYCN